MAKSNKSRFYIRGGKMTTDLVKGTGHSEAALEREIMRRAIAMKYAGKSEEEILTWFKETFNV